MVWKIVFDGKVDFIKKKRKVIGETDANILFDDGSKYFKRNKLNNLVSNEWLKFQKSWFIFNPESRLNDVVKHPATFPSEMAADFIRFFTKEGATVLDPMVGTGSTVVGAVLSGRNGIGIELQEKYANVASKRLSFLSKQTSLVGHKEVSARIYNGDARDVDKMGINDVDFVITSPPYWDMLREKGAETQKERKMDKMDTCYSDDSNDVGNISDYDSFVETVCSIYEGIGNIMKSNAYLTIVVKNVKKGGVLYPLAWDIARRLSNGSKKVFTLKDEKIWCQDNIRLAPFGYGNAWVSNTVHHYCLNFQKR